MDRETLETAFRRFGGIPAIARSEGGSAKIIDVFMAETAALREEKNKLGHFNVHVMARANKAEAALRQIMAIKDDILGKREGDESEGTKDFDRGCRMAFYRCAEIARNALG